MHVETLRIRNFRRLKDVRIDLARDISIFVGANNSGKTSASQALQLFTTASRDKFTIHDFNAECWPQIDAFGERSPGVTLPKISLDIWFHIEASDLHRVVDLLPSLDWEGSVVGLRIEFLAADETALLARFDEARGRARANARTATNGAVEYHPSPRALREYLTDNLRPEYELRYYVLDRAQFDPSFIEVGAYVPPPLTPDKGRSGKDILNSLLRVDLLRAQRHLSDSAGGSQAEDLSRCLSRFYERNLEKRGDDHDAIRALANAETMLDAHLQKVFEPTLARLGTLGYPGLTNPRLLIKSALNPATIMGGQDGAKVHYALGDPQTGVELPTLPDNYSGLGFRNLIYMVVELLGIHAQWVDIEEDRPPLHLIFVEEPEVHLHAQLQQVFIREITKILAIEGVDQAHYTSQLVISTHSPHILYERGFRPIRYFRRRMAGPNQYSEVLNLSAFYESTADPIRDFLERYLKLTHCDLFFADAAVLVEGNVERLLIPQMIEKAAPRLKSAYLSILEIGGAFGHRFRTLIEFLGITALIVTDIDSVTPPAGLSGAARDGVAGGPETEDHDEEATGKSCMVNQPNAVTSNQTLIQWLPKKTTIADLLTATSIERTQSRATGGDALIHVTYQSRVDMTWNGRTIQMTGRTLEEAFAFENLAWCQDVARADLNLLIRNSGALTADEIGMRLHKKIRKSGFNKTDFALALLAQNPSDWAVPLYIVNGLQWLQEEVARITPQPIGIPAGVGA